MKKSIKLISSILLVSGLVGFRYPTPYNETEMELLKFMQGYNARIEQVTQSSMTVEEKKQEVKIIYKSFQDKCHSLGLSEYEADILLGDEQ